jgi:hypothetical protein
MKPLNLDNKPCSPISSNCVIWQGPDIPCIKLCTGDTVSDVIAKLATELCTVLDILNVTNYDLSCFNLVGCGPNDFQALVQFLIEQICALQNPTTTTVTNTDRSEALVTVADCFVVSGVTVMTVSEYAQAIGTKVCSLVSQIAAINLAITSLDIRVTALEGEPAPTFVLPSILVNCTLSPSVLAGNSYTIDLVLNALINTSTTGYCSLLSATGTPASIIAAVQSQCIADSDDTLTSGVPFATAYAGSWVDNGDLSTAADAINNLWLVVCDIYTAFASLTPPTSSVTAGNGIAVTTTTVGVNTNYQVAYVEKPILSVLLAPPANLNKTVPGLGTGRLCDGSIQLMTTIQQNTFSPTDYNSSTGIFTIPTTGIYTLSFWVHYSRESGTGWYDAAVPGMFIAGIMSPTGCNFYCANNVTPAVIMQHLDITGVTTTKLTAGQQVCLKVINLTNYNYATVVGDIVQMSIKRVN